MLFLEQQLFMEIWLNDNFNNLFQVHIIFFVEENCSTTNTNKYGMVLI
jgi:hypothetical protein